MRQQTVTTGARGFFPPRQSMWDLWWTEWHSDRFSPLTCAVCRHFHSINFSFIIIQPSNSVSGQLRCWLQNDSRWHDVHTKFLETWSATLTFCRNDTIWECHKVCVCFLRKGEWGKYGTCSALYGTPLHHPISDSFVCNPNSEKRSHHFNKYKVQRYLG